MHGGGSGCNKSEVQNFNAQEIKIIIVIITDSS